MLRFHEARRGDGQLEQLGEQKIDGFIQGRDKT
jgi:hypothetical protein